MEIEREMEMEMEVPVLQQQPQPPLIFLSHSGSEKDFTERLYHELVHLNHHPFFDQDAQHSLPKGQEFPTRIVEACRQCKMGVVVLSHDYIESPWPMLELEQLLFHSSAEIYPLFYKLKPADLKNEENLRRWKNKWDEHAVVLAPPPPPSTSSHSAQISINISLWPEALEKLRVGRIGTFTALQHVKLLWCCKLQEFPNINLSNLLSLDLSNNINLVDVGRIGTFTALQQVKLCGCSKLQEFPNINLRNLLSLDLSRCEKLVSMQGSVCALTALEELNLGGCRKLERIPDLKNLARLRLLSASGCRSLKELKGVSGLTSLQSLKVTECISLVQFNPDLSSLSALDSLIPDTNVQYLEPGGINGGDSQMACARLGGLNAFVNLRKLEIEDDSCNIFSLDVSGLANLEVLHMVFLRSLQVIPGLSALVNLQNLLLSDCSSLEQIPGLDALTNLKDLHISDCSSLETLDISNCSSLETPDFSNCPSLENLQLSGCSSLKQIPGLSALVNLKNLLLSGCSSLKQIPGLDALTNLKDLYISTCPSLETLPDLRGLTSLKSLCLRECSSLQVVSENSSFAPSSLMQGITNAFDYISTLMQAIPGVDGLANLNFLSLKGDSTCVQILPLFVSLKLCLEDWGPVQQQIVRLTPNYPIYCTAVSVTIPISFLSKTANRKANSNQ